jgi:hypothetical protein
VTHRGNAGRIQSDLSAGSSSRGAIHSEQSKGHTARNSAPLRAERHTTRLGDINPFHATGEPGTLIDETDRWGKGYGTEVTRLMLDYGFTALGLHNIMLTAFSFNERGLRAYTRAGFREIGRRREAFRLGGQAYDVVYMDCLAAEFKSPVLRQGLEPGGRMSERRS